MSGAGGVEVRAVVAQDLDGWAPLFRAYGEFYRTTFSDDVVAHVGRMLLEPDSGIEGAVAVIDDEVIGFAHFRSHPDTFGTGRDWFLDDLYVEPDARRSGAGTALIEYVTAAARAAGPGTLRWITAADNTTAQRVYDRLASRTTWVTYERRI